MKGRNRMKKTLFLLIVILALFSFAAVRADDLADVQKAGEMRLGIAPEYIPFVFYDKDGNLSGIDVALIEEIAISGQCKNFYSG